MNYQFTTDLIARRLVPPALRRPKHLRWVQSLLAGVQTVQDNLLAFIDQKNYEASFTGQTLQLERLLNDAFDNASRRIRIEGSTADYDYDYFASEGQTPDYDYFDSEGASARYLYFPNENLSGISEDFAVFVPTALSGDESRINANLLKYKIAGPTYEIIYE